MTAKKLVKTVFSRERVMTESSDAARDFYNQGRFGVLLEDGRVQLSFMEAFYLFEKNKLQVFDGRNKEVLREPLLKKFRKIGPRFWVRYCVFRDMRSRGYIIKTALKFGADFRVYERGVRPGEDHAKWVVFPVNEGEVLTWHEFAAKNRVAHSTRKRLLIGVVDYEGDVSYWEVRWVKP